VDHDNSNKNDPDSELLHSLYSVAPSLQVVEGKG
jgi:hypothetical protein